MTLQYHFDGLGAFKPYVGAGVQWIHFFNEGTSANALGATSVDVDDGFGLALQAGVDLALGDGWYLNADVKKVWLDTDVTWNNTALGTVQADVDLDPWIISGRRRLPLQHRGPVRRPLDPRPTEVNQCSRPGARWRWLQRSLLTVIPARAGIYASIPNRSVKCRETPRLSADIAVLAAETCVDSPLYSGMTAVRPWPHERTRRVSALQLFTGLR